MSKIMDLINWLTRTVGKFLYAIPFLLFGGMHFAFGGQMAEMVPIPGGIIWIYFTGIALIAASISIMIGKKDKLAAFLLGLMLILFAFLVEMPMMLEYQGVMEAAEEGSQAASLAEMLMNSHSGRILMDIALGGAAWMYAGSVGAKDKS